MHFSLTILLCILSFTVNAQSKWSLYLHDIDSAYDNAVTRLDQEGSFHYRYFSGYSFIPATYDHTTSEKTNRAGVILEAKSTKYHTIHAEIKMYGGNDSLTIKFINEYSVVRHGRSATLSVLNAFSKKENRVKQDAPTEEVRDKQTDGTIFYDGDSYDFTPDKIVIDDQKYHITGIKKVINNKNGKIKSANSYEGLQVMRGGRCVAAIYYASDPQEYFLDKSLTWKERLVLVGWLGVRGL